MAGGRRLGGRRGGVVGGAERLVGADLGVGGGDLGPVRRRVRSAAEEVVAQRRRPSPRVPRRWAPRSGRSRTNAAEASEVAARAVDRRGDHDGDGGQAGRVLGRDRQRGQGDHPHRRADQPAGAERHHRGGPGRRGRQGLRRRRQRGQGAGAGDGEGHRGHRPPGAGDPGRHHRRGGRDRGDLQRSSRRSPTGRPPSPARWRSRPPRRTRCRGRCRRPPAARREIASNITGVSTAAESTTQALTQTRTAVDELSRMAADLRTTVGRFTY